LIGVLFSFSNSLWGADVRGDFKSSAVISLDGDDWLIATDADNVGKDQKWWEGPRLDAKPTKVPWIIQEVFPYYYGLAWYWKDFVDPANSHEGGRYLMKFVYVDYKADVWVNGVYAGSHETGDNSFTLDVTDGIKPGKANRVAVRVLNPRYEPIDGITLNETPHRNRGYPMRLGCDANNGGIEGSVDLIVVPAVYVSDIFVVPNPKTGIMEIETTVVNSRKKAVAAGMELAVSPAFHGQMITSKQEKQTLPKGENVIHSQIKMVNPRLWDIDDPYLYRLSVRVTEAGSDSFDESSTRCGFRDFRFEDGYFRLNGKRLFLKCSHTGDSFPIGIHLPPAPDLLQRDLLNVKAMGFNAIRFISGVALKPHLDYCDEIGLMVYEEAAAAWCLNNSDKMAERFNLSTFGMIQRDRNHPSVVMWGLLNETVANPVFMHAVSLLPKVRKYDNSRLVMLNSGRFDGYTKGGGIVGPATWRAASLLVPNVTFNSLDNPITFDGTTWAPGQLALHPGISGEYSVLRWTCPAADSYEIAAKFTGIAANNTSSDIHIICDGKAVFDSFLNLEGQGNTAEYSGKVDLKKGKMIDVVVGMGNGNPYSDTTALEMKIISGKGKVYDVVGDFTLQKNPNGVWSYAYLPYTDKPDLSAFALLDKAESETKSSIGSLSNPGSVEWEDVLDDQHPYRRVPQLAGDIQFLRTVGNPPKPYFISEYGIGSANHLPRLVRLYQQYNGAHTEDYAMLNGYLGQFMNDWQNWKLYDTFANPDEYFDQSLARMGSQREQGWNAIRANPNMVGYSLTGTVDQGTPSCAEGLTTAFRELKPGTMDALFASTAKLRLCLFAEPVNLYRGQEVQLDAVLANEDALKPGTYPVRLQVVGPNNESIYDKTVEVEVADKEPPFAMTFSSEKINVDGPSGKYRFLANFQSGGAATGGESVFYLADPADMPTVTAEVVLWGDDGELEQWLKAKGIPVRKFDSAVTGQRQLILVSGQPQSPGGAAAFGDLAGRIAGGSSVVFLVPGVFRDGDNSTRWVPLKNKGSIGGISRWLYLADDWAKKHPIFDGLQSGELLDFTMYREIIPNEVWYGQEKPAEVVAGSIAASLGYSSGLTITVHKLGAGSFILNTLWIRGNLGTVPPAERLLRNMLNYAAQNIDQPIADLPGDFANQLKAMGY
jgi:hypothetical protein